MLHQRHFMLTSKQYYLLAFCISLLLLPSCSRLDDSTDLGGNVIEDIYPDKVTLGKHFREYVMDSAALANSFSLPGSGDPGFGVHEATGSSMLIGMQGDQRAAGYVQFICTPDTGATRRNEKNDTVKSVVLRFVRDTAVPSCRVAVWYSNIPSHALNPDAANGDSILDTMEFTKDTVAVPDSVVLPDPLAGMIFMACTTSNKDSARAHYARDTFGFIISVVQCDSLVRLNGNPQMVVRFKRGADTTGRNVTYGSSNTSYYCAEDIAPDTLDTIPALRYASKRTAVFQYDMSQLWNTTDDLADPRSALTVSAVFPLQGPQDKDTLTLRCLLWHNLERDGTVLDSLFAGKNQQSLPGLVTINDTAQVLANVCTALQWYEKNDRSPTMYLYLRFNENVKQVWKKTRWTGAPLLTAMISVP